MSHHATRRSFLTAAGAAAVGLAAGAHAQQQQNRRGHNARRPNGRRPVVISSSNGLAAVGAAYDRLRAGADPLDAVIAGVRLVEDDPDDMSVGLGGLPNEQGVVELDASVMHGPQHRSGAVAALRNIKNPSAVAREVARRTDHCLLVGEGALQFAKQMGFEEENLLTEKARQAWLKWKSTLNKQDDWLDPEQFDLPTTNGADDRVRAEDVPFTYGTIHCSGVNANGDIAGTTTTSGLSWKLPGRVGDSPIIGAGLYTDNEVGSAGATGRGEAVIQVCGARTAVMRMEMGDHPTDACLYVLDLIAKKTKSPRLLNDRGEPNFNVIMYAANKEGAYGSACMREGRQFAVCDEQGPRREDCAYLFTRR